MKQWLNTEFVSSCSKTTQFKSFARQFRNAIKKALPENSELANFNTGHFYCSGFVKRGEAFVYFSISDVRHFAGEWYNHVLVRTAQHEKDFTGGCNNYTTLENFGREVDTLLQIMEGGIIR